MRRRRLITLAAAAGVLAAASAAVPGSSGARPQYLWQCIAISREDARFRCYTRLLLERVELSRDPARELPRIDREVRESGGEIVGSCHALMHEIGRRYGRAHNVTLATLRRYIPHSNDPTCSAGFGMGLVMHLGPELVRSGGRRALASCLGLPTRYRSYTCVHGLGHALMRGYHGQLKGSVEACRALGAHGIDCAQGAFHDYWISLRGAGTVRPRSPVTSPRTICDGRFTYVRPCWYRYFIEQRFGRHVETAADVRRACAGLSPLQRAGCVGGASLALSLSSKPLDQTRLCASLRDADARACIRGVAVQALARQPRAQHALIRSCASFARGARGACYSWYGRTLALVTNGRFDCRGLPTRGAAKCRAGARRVQDPFVTFS
jgi:hypothetical protein